MSANDQRPQTKRTERWLLRKSAKKLAVLFSFWTRRIKALPQ